MNLSRRNIFILSVVILLLTAAIWLIPKYQAANYLGKVVTDLESLEPKDRVAAIRDIELYENSARTTLAQIVGGIVILSGLYFTYLNARIAQETLGVAEEGKITERFSKAVELLGNEKLDVRLGGIYALERIARDSQKDHWTVMEVLTAFVRENSPDTNEYFENEAGEMQLSRSIGTKPENVKLREDIQAILTVIGRREWSETEKGRLNLMEVDLSGYVLHKANLRGANLMGAILSGTNLSETNLSDTNLMGASLVGANLYKADLSKTDLSEANLSGADLFHSNLIGAYLLAADLSQANLIRANLSGADLAEAILSRAHLSDTDLKSALNITFAQIKKAKNFEKAVLSLNLEAELKEWQAKQPAKNPIKVANGDK